MTVQVVRAGERRRVPWRNGAGTTEEIATGDLLRTDRPRWRLSLADLGSAPSGFSAFPGVDRIFTVVGEHDVDLDFGDGPRTVRPWQPHPFAGEDAPHCLPLGATSAFNVMIERGAATASVSPIPPGAHPVTDPREVTALFVRSGLVRAGAVQAGSGDCLLVHDEALALRGDTASGLLVRIAPEPRPRPDPV
ncbi:HutD family protein [Rhodococcus sp. Z13]|uniref:HutD family protein n=1 Tax=Rhodococcus sacchari TaxID=2962047 RepID=A0ACD4DK75_9NOCA|nr:HutD family protein [Rhodococcus sp. Z13]UYP20453.1 HutD family protein [Rhodococcus sp. Z13]